MLSGNRSGSLRTISTRIHTMPNTHNRNASNLITSKNGTLNRSRTTPTGQQRSMNIHNTQRRHMQHLIRQNAAIGSHAEDISLRSCELINNLRRHTISLNNRQTQLQRTSLNRRRLQLLTTPTNSIRTSDNQRNLIPSRNKRSQRRHRKIGRTHKHNTHKTDPSKPEPRRLQITAESQSPSPSAKTVQQEQIYPKPKKEPHQKQLSQQRHYQRRRPSLAQRHPGEKGARTTQSPGQGPHISSRAQFRSKARMFEHGMICVGPAPGTDSPTPSRPVERRGPGRPGTP